MFSLWSFQCLYFSLLTLIFAGPLGVQIQPVESQRNLAQLLRIAAYYDLKMFMNILKKNINKNIPGCSYSRFQVSLKCFLLYFFKNPHVHFENLGRNLRAPLIVISTFILFSESKRPNVFRICNLIHVVEKWHLRFTQDWLEIFKLNTLFSKLTP